MSVCASGAISSVFPFLASSASGAAFLPLTQYLPLSPFQLAQAASSAASVSSISFLSHIAQLLDPEIRFKSPSVRTSSSSFLNEQQLSNDDTVMLDSDSPSVSSSCSLPCPCSSTSSTSSAATTTTDVVYAVSSSFSSNKRKQPQISASDTGSRKKKKAPSGMSTALSHLPSRPCTEISSA